MPLFVNLKNFLSIPPPATTDWLLHQMNEYIVEMRLESDGKRSARFENLMKCSVQYTFTSQQKVRYTNLVNTYKHIYNGGQLGDVIYNDLTDSLLE